MKSGFLKMIKTAIAPLALVVAMAFSPVAALAAGRGGGHGFSGGGHAGGFGGGGHAYSAQARGNFGGRAYSAPARGFVGGARGGFYGGRAYYGGRGYYGPGFGFGVGVYAPYGYAAPVCNPAGFYDQYGNWQVYPGCAVPYGY
ncbi:MAG TPA: hypothetical protein VK724_21390 [Bryobacteraceae bacterium]|jgi:hypothetical protein|nr:hypothetical protein [Bryobacteraceae bacterium]